MARKLSVAQKTLLKGRTEMFCDNLPPELYDKLNKMNCYENMDTDIDRFLSDQHFERQNKKAHQGRLKI